MMQRESSKIARRAARVEKLSKTSVPSAPVLPPVSARYDWNAESGILGATAAGADIDPREFDLPEGLPARRG
jgi:hypothetical protein